MNPNSQQIEVSESSLLIIKKEELTKEILEKNFPSLKNMSLQDSKNPLGIYVNYFKKTHNYIIIVNLQNTQNKRRS